MFENVWTKIQLMRAFFILIKDPNQTERIFKIGDIIRKRNQNKIPPGLQPIFDHPEFKALYAERYHPHIDQDALRKLPENTFGGAMARFLDLNGFDANAFPSAGDGDEISYLVTRIRQTHDMWHVLTGYGTGVPSELALQGFMMSQLGVMVSAFIISGGILHTAFYKPTELRSTFALIVEGYRLGQLSKPLVNVKWEEYWSEDLNELRTRFGLNLEVHSETLFLNGQEDYRRRRIYARA